MGATRPIYLAPIQTIRVHDPAQKDTGHRTWLMYTTGLEIILENKIKLENKMWFKLL